MWKKGNSKIYIAEGFVYWCDIFSILFFKHEVECCILNSKTFWYHVSLGHFWAILLVATFLKIGPLSSTIRSYLKGDSMEKSHLSTLCWWKVSEYNLILCFTFQQYVFDLHDLIWNFVGIGLWVWGFCLLVSATSKLLCILGQWNVKDTRYCS